MTTHTKAATGNYTKDGTPHGSTSITPHIVVSPAARALELYLEVFRPKLGNVTRMGETIAHAELDFGAGKLTLSDPLATYDLAAPTGKGVTYSLCLYVPDVDAVVERAVAAGARLREPLTTFVSGDRYASLVDPFGVRWTIMTRVEDLSPEESARRVARWATEQAAAKAQ